MSRQSQFPSSALPELRVKEMTYGSIVEWQMGLP